MLYKNMLQSGGDFILGGGTVGGNLTVTGFTQLNGGGLFPTGISQYYVAATPTVGAEIVGSSVLNQWLFAPSSGLQRAMIVTDRANTAKDHDVTLQTNPTLFGFSATDPDTDNTQWWSITHDQTDAVITTGTGDLKLAPSGVVSFGSHSALGGESVSGYITIKDSGGTSRKIAVVS
jgi:hypothetical protein